MSAPYDDSAQKEWKERKGKIEGFYREMGQVGTPGKEKVSSTTTRIKNIFKLYFWSKRLRGATSDGRSDQERPTKINL